MPLFHVKILSKNGQVEELIKEATDVQSLEAELSRNGLLVAEIKERQKQKRFLAENINKLRNKLSPGTLKDEDIYNLFYELGIILKAGVPIMKAFHMIIEETGKEAVKKFMEEVMFELKEGRSFSDILEKIKTPYDFKSYIPIIRMGEKTGQMGQSFLDIAAGIEKWMKIKSEISNALVYPLILIGTSLVAVYVMLVYVIPRFQAIVKDFKVVLPFQTRLLFSFSSFLNNNQDMVLVGMIVFFLVLLLLSRNERFKKFGHDLMNRMPLISSLKFSSENIHFLQSLSNLMAGGVPILSALTLSLESFSSERIKDRLKQAGMSICKGETLATALKATGIFPEIIPNMLRVGEESGTLPEVLKELYNFMSERFLKRIKRYMNFLEPLIILFVAVFIGVIIMTILPIIMNISDINM